MRLALKVAPQRSTQYARLAATLAEPELRTSPLGARLGAIEHRHLAGQHYLVAELAGDLGARDRLLLGRLGTIGECHEYFDRLGEFPGPLLRPLETPVDHFLPHDLVETRRYRGKTNELFTDVLLNLALFASAFRERLDEPLRVLDPLAGGGTTLFAALIRGYHAVGIEREREDIDSTTAFARQYLREHGVPFKYVDERIRGVGRRHLFTVGPPPDTRLLGLILGDSTAAPELLHGLPGGARFHVLVTDLPYGIQHEGSVRDLLATALPAWQRCLYPGGAGALAWDATRLPRETVGALVRRHTDFIIVEQPPFTGFAHTVDRQIRRRDVLLVRHGA